MTFSVRAEDPVPASANALPLARDGVMSFLLVVERYRQGQS